MHSSDKPVNSDVLETLRQLEESLWRAETRFDKVHMNEVCAADYFEFGRSGKVYSRSEFLADQGATSTIDAVLPLPNFSARHLAEDVVQVTYVSEATYDGHLVRGNRSSIWSRTSGGWELRFHQGTPVR